MMRLKTLLAKALHHRKAITKRPMTIEWAKDGI